MSKRMFDLLEIIVRVHVDHLPLECTGPRAGQGGEEAKGDFEIGEKIRIDDAFLFVLVALELGVIQNDQHGNVTEQWIGQHVREMM